MKNLHLALVLCFIPLMCSSQIIWEEIATVNKEFVEIIHVTPEDEIIGALDFPPQLLISRDLGNNWELLSADPVIEQLLDNTLYTFTEDLDGDLYFGFENQIYSIDKNSGKLDQFLVAEGNSFRIEDFAFLPTGNLVVADNRNIQVYNPAGQLLNSKDWWTHTVKFLIGPDDEHYVVQSLGASNYIGIFNSDLTELTPGDGYIAPRADLFLFDGNRIYNESVYSDDGINWTEYPNGISGLITLLDNGNLHLIDRDEVFLSRDGGTSFDLVGTISESFTSTYSTMSAPVGNQNILLWERKSINTGQLYLLESGGDLDLRENQLGSSNLFYIEAYDLDNMFIGSSSRGPDLFRTSANQNWTEIEFDLGTGCHFFYEIATTSDGTVVSGTGCRSTDNGQNWTASDDVAVGLGEHIDLKNDELFIVDYQSSYRSRDHGSTWETIEHLEDANLYDPPLAISASGFMYVAEVFISASIFKMGLDGEVIHGVAPPAPNLSLVDLETSYEGPNVYALYDDWNQAPILAYSYDDGHTIQSLVLEDVEIDYSSRLQTDHLGNVYIITEDKLWISQDEGQSWQDITPDVGTKIQINDIDVGWDNHIYLALSGAPILRTASPLSEPTQLTVRIFEDLNDNCVYDQGEPGLENIRVNVGDRILKNTDSDGNASSIVVPATYDVEAQLRSDLFETCGNNLEVELIDNSVHVDIAVMTISNCADIQVGASIPFLRRCFDNTYYLDLYNEGTETATGVEMTLTLDAFFDFIDSDMTLVATQDKDYTFSIPDIPARTHHRAYIEFNLSCDAELGQEHYMTADLVFDNPCELQTRSTEAFECLENIGSYDPNDKAIYLNGFADKDVIGTEDEIEYLIRFQNTGTDTAFTVRVEDELTEDFDLSSVWPVAASHDFTWELDRSRLVVTFDDIQLVDSTKNEADSHGFIKFNVQLKDNRPEPGSIVENTAEIYFDFNDPIVTNTVETSYLCKDTQTNFEETTCEGEPYFWPLTNQNYSVTGWYTVTAISEMGCDSSVTLQLTVLSENHPDCLLDATDDIEKNNEIVLYPLPAQDELHILNKNFKPIRSYEVLSNQGAVFLTGKLGSNNSISLTDCPDGIYVVKLFMHDETIVYKRLVVVR